MIWVERVVYIVTIAGLFIWGCWQRYDRDCLRNLLNIQAEVKKEEK